MKRRKLTDDLVRNIALQFQTRADFQTYDNSAYTAARKRGREYLDDVCKHMITVKFSIPQLMCKKILETLLKVECRYNDRVVIKPYELDIYFEKYKLAFEYNGKHWHRSEDSNRRDSLKKERCVNSGIKLIIIEESNHRSNYERDIKQTIIDNIEIIENSVGFKISHDDIYNVSCDDIYDDVLKYNNMDDIKEKINSCVNILDFSKNYRNLYNKIISSGQHKLLDDIRVKRRDVDTVLNECYEIKDYNIFRTKHRKLYTECIKKNILSAALSHMINRPYEYFDKKDLINRASSYMGLRNLKHNDYKLYSILRRKYSDELYNIKFSKYTIKDRKNDCMNMAKVYSTVEEFKSDIKLYQECKKLIMINDVLKLYPPELTPREKIKKECLKFITVNDFRNSPLYEKSWKFKGLTKEIKNIIRSRY